MSGPQRAIYPARRAIEQACATPELRPQRLFGVLWPLHRVVVSARVDRPQAYEIIDHHLVRTVVDARIAQVGAIADFLGIELPLLQSCLDYLVRTEHVTLHSHGPSTVVEVTERGLRSIRSGRRWEVTESQLELLLDQYTGAAFPRSHYPRSLAILPTPDLPTEQKDDRTRFVPLFAEVPYQENAVQAEITRIAAAPDRADYNLDGQLYSFDIGSQSPGYLPAYLIETATGIVAYTGLSDSRRDHFLEGLCRHLPSVTRSLRAEPMADPREVWRSWLDRRRLDRRLLRQTADGWQVILPASAFGDQGRLPVTLVGSYEVEEHLFLRLWTEDEELRRRAVLDRAVGMAPSFPDVPALDHAVGRLAQQLQVSVPDLVEIRAHAVKTGRADRLARLLDPPAP